MAELIVKWDDEARVARFGTFLGATLTRAKAGLLKSGFAVEAQIKKNLSGKRSPGNPYPGWVTSNLRRSVTAQAESNGMVVKVGPNTVYAAIQEFGGRITITEAMRRYLHATGIHLRASTTAITIPPRAYVKPAWRQSKDKVINIMLAAIGGRK